MPTDTINALSLWQPWASAIAVGIKRIETRSWSTSYRGPLAIHAAKRWTEDQKIFAATVYHAGRLPSRVPLGAVVAIADLVDCVPVEQVASTLSPLERTWGNYSPGRFAWILENVRPVDPPGCCRGRQGLFNITAPECADVLGG